MSRPRSPLDEFVEQTFFKRPTISSLKSGGSRSDYRTQVNHFSTYLLEALAAEGQPVRLPAPQDLTAARIQAAMNWQLARGRTRSTANKIKRVLVALANEAALKELIPAPKKVSCFKEPKREPTCWSDVQFTRILEGSLSLPGSIGPWPTGLWLSALLWLVYNSGLRITAVMATRWDWIDFSERRLIVPPEVQKDDEGAVVILLPETIEALSAIRNPQSAIRNRVVFGDWPHDGLAEWLQKPLGTPREDSWRCLTRLLRRAIVAGGLVASQDQVGRRDLWHKIRRTFATYVTIAAGIETARQMLGHSTVQVTWRYIDKSKLVRKSQADLLPRLQLKRQLNLVM